MDNMHRDLLVLANISTFVIGFSMTIDGEIEGNYDSDLLDKGPSSNSGSSVLAKVEYVGEHWCNILYEHFNTFHVVWPFVCLNWANTSLLVISLITI